jgi:hypothetical protein
VFLVLLVETQYGTTHRICVVNSVHTRVYKVWLKERKAWNKNVGKARKESTS